MPFIHELLSGTDQRWTPGHRHKDGVCDKHLKHGDWRGQRVWQVPTATLTRHFDDIVVMLQAAAVTCSEEPAVVRLQQPCHVFGDIHGNFSDLKYFESLLWPLGVPFTAGSFLWLGDYVDRGACARAHFCVSALDYVYLILVFRVQALRLWRPSCIFPGHNAAFCGHKALIYCCNSSAVQVHALSQGAIPLQVVPPQRQPRGT